MLDLLSCAPLDCSFISGAADCCDKNAFYLHIITISCRMLQITKPVGIQFCFVAPDYKPDLIKCMYSMWSLHLHLNVVFSCRPR